MHKLVGINSLRFFAIVFIVTYHLFREFLPGGYLAVEIFFCLSGFLISAKIINQIDANRELKYGQFIKSRIKRLYPTLLAMVALTLVLGIFIAPDILTGARRNTLTALTFTTNISELITGGNYENTFLPNVFEHTWFLALLFQFYLLLPLILKLHLAVFKTKRNAIKFFGISLLALSIISAILMACYGGLFEMQDRAYFALDSHMGAFCLGGAFAVFKFFVPRTPRTVKGIPTLGLILCSIAMVVLALRIDYSNPFAFIFAMPFMAFLTIITLACIIKLQHNIRERRKTMNVVRVFEGLGNLSYGVYLFHWPLYILLPHLLPSDTALWGYALINILLSFALAYVVFELSKIKKPWQKIRKSRRIIKASYATITAGIIAVMTITLVRAPQASSIAEQLSQENNHSSAELISSASVDSDFVNATRLLESTIEIMNTELALAQNAETLPAPSGSLAAPNANSAKVLVIGDSVTLGAKQAIEATIAKSFVDAKENRGIETATGILSGYAASGKLPSTIVISLATNQRTITEALLQDIVNVAGSGHKFILVTAYAGPLQPRDEQNATLKSFASKHSNVYLADWWSIAHDNWSLMYADHIHLNPSGRIVYANLISNVIRGMR
ncbi:acyltransferase [Candidatus Saccharibacteria bacterium]|nr:acyltransferase [Candidatus Saccharibacteria bacterium]